jgi:hypothetical protein
MKKDKKTQEIEELQFLCRRYLELRLVAVAFPIAHNASLN